MTNDMATHIAEYDELLIDIKRRISEAPPPQLIGIAGPPATGKSTLAERLVADLIAAGQAAALCPMDGFHLSNAQLADKGLTQAKGSIDTFDSHAFATAVSHLKMNKAFWWPLYCRQRHEPVAEGTQIEGTEAFYIIEGNYVLATAEPWCTAAQMLNLRIFVDTPDKVLHERLLQRHQQGGRSTHEALQKIEHTDLPNAYKIRTERLIADIEFSIAGQSDE